MKVHAKRKRIFVHRHIFFLHRDPFVLEIKSRPWFEYNRMLIACVRGIFDCEIY